MHELGYVENKDFVMEWRFADGNYDLLLGLATELAQLKVDVIVTTLTFAAKAAQQATKIIPIVMAYSNDPVGNGVIASFNRPGGNVTGLASSADDTTPKQLELLTTVVPNLSRISVLVNPSNFFSHAPMLKSAQISADTLGLVALTAEARNLQELDAAFVEMNKERAGAMMVIADSFFVLRRQRIAELALRARLPTIFPTRDSVEVGGLMSYGNSLAEFFRQAATYVDRIFKGAKPAELPVEQPTKFLFGSKPQNREGSRPRSARQATRARRRGDRIAASIAASDHGRFWHSCDIATDPVRSGYGANRKRNAQAEFFSVWTQLRHGRLKSFAAQKHCSFLR
jgi:putative tryptophan/tyrosine transport system substrate-binding protein